MTNKSIDWQRVACLSLVVSVAAAAIVLAPAWAENLGLANQARKVQEQALLALEYQGLATCKADRLSYYDDVDKLIDSSVKGKARVSITVAPSFSEEWGLRLIGDDIFLVRLDKSRWEQHVRARAEKRERGKPYSLPSFDTSKIKTQVNHAALAPSIARNVAEIYGKSIASADDRRPLGVDGVDYFFQAPGICCAKAWSPDEESRAGRLVELLGLLAAHAELTKLTDINASERRIERLLKSLNRH